MHYYQFHVGDYVKSTPHLSNDEDLAYRRLLDMYYDTERKIPNDIPWVSRRLRLPEKVIEIVLKDFFIFDDGWKNPRADQEIELFHGFLEKQRLNGKLGGRPKKTHGLPTANPDLTQPKPKKSLTNSQFPIPINQEPKNTTRVRAIAKPDGVDESVWVDFLQIRKAKKSPLTQTAIDGITREAAKAGLTLGNALAVCCERGWQGFKADWMASLTQGRDKGLETDYQRAMRLRMQEACPEIARKDPAKVYEDPVQFFNTIDVQAVEIKSLGGKS
jgi:uncharacterized protein YdaU (DUF1376 family)